MPGLIDQANGPANGPLPKAEEAVERAQRAWQESMLRQVDALRQGLVARRPQQVAQDCAAAFDGADILIPYWGRRLAISWPGLQARGLDGAPCSMFDTAMLLYHLHCADGFPLAERWIGFRDLPDGAFYSQAFQGYSGERLARRFGQQPEAFEKAARSLDGLPLPGLPGLAYAFHPLPRLRLAAILYPGDEEFPARASILFDAAASHYMTTDGLALLGAGLARRIEKHG
jgi:hypothetical protein